MNYENRTYGRCVAQELSQKCEMVHTILKKKKGISPIKFRVAQTEAGRLHSTLTGFLKNLTAMSKQGRLYFFRQSVVSFVRIRSFAKLTYLVDK